MLESFGNRVIVRFMDSGEKSSKGGIVLLDDNGKQSGIHPRWSQVYKIGNKVTDLEVGDWVLVAHGRWSYGFDDYDDEGNKEKFWIVDYPKYVLMKSKTKPEDFETLPKYKS